MEQDLRTDLHETVCKKSPLRGTMYSRVYEHPKQRLQYRIAGREVCRDRL